MFKKNKSGYVSKLVYACLISIFLLSSLLGQAAAEEIDYQGPFVKLYGGLNILRDSEFTGSDSNSFPSGEMSFDTGPVFGLAGGYRFNRNFAGELDYAYRSNDNDKMSGISGGRMVEGGDLASVAIMANGYYFFDFAKSWSPYVGLGIGYLQEIDADVKLSGIAEQTDLEDEAFAWQAMIGAEVPLDNNWRFYGEGRFMTAPGPELRNKQGSYDLDYENISLIIGIGYQF